MDLVANFIIILKHKQPTQTAAQDNLDAIFIRIQEFNFDFVLFRI